MLTSLAINTICVISIIFCGHLGKTELAAVGLAISVFNVTGLAIIQGLGTACDTLFSQVSLNLENKCFKIGWAKVILTHFLLSM